MSRFVAQDAVTAIEVALRHINGAEDIFHGARVEARAGDTEIEVVLTPSGGRPERFVAYFQRAEPTS